MTTQGIKCGCYDRRAPGHTCCVSAGKCTGCAGRGWYEDLSGVRKRCTTCSGTGLAILEELGARGALEA